MDFFKMWIFYQKVDIYQNVDIFHIRNVFFKKWIFYQKMDISSKCVDFFYQKNG